MKYSCPPCLPAFPGYYHPGYSCYGAIWVVVMSNGDPSGQNHSFGHLSAKCPFPPSNSSWSRNSDWTLSHLILCLSLMCIKRINLQKWFYFWRVFWFVFFSFWFLCQKAWVWFQGCSLKISAVLWPKQTKFHVTPQPIFFSIREMNIHIQIKPQQIVMMLHKELKCYFITNKVKKPFEYV